VIQAHTLGAKKPISLSEMRKVKASQYREFYKEKLNEDCYTSLICLATACRKIYEALPWI